MSQPDVAKLAKARPIGEGNWPHQPRLVSVIVPVLNGAATLPTQLEALSRQAYPSPWEVVIVDNGSTDGSVSVADAWRGRLPGLRVIDASARRGASHARNAGSQAARGDLLVFTDHDDLVHDGWLEALVEAAASAHAVGGELEVELLNDALVRSDRNVARGQLPVIAGGQVPFASSNNFAVWREVLEHLGGWNGRYRSADDREFCWRLQLQGFRLDHAPEAIVHYRYRRDLAGRLRQIWAYSLGSVRLYRDFRAVGATRRTVSAAIKTWGWLFLHLPDLLKGGAARRRLLKGLVYNAGQFVGSIRFRVFHV